MNESELQSTVWKYYRAWARQDRGEVRSLLADDLDFRSPQDRFTGADEFLDACWRYSEGLAGVEFLREIYDGEQAFVVFAWAVEPDGRFAGAECLRVVAGKIHQILVINNSPEFGELFAP